MYVHSGYNVSASAAGATLGDAGSSSGGVLENATGVPSWGFKAALALIGVGFLVRALEPAAHAGIRVAHAAQGKRRNPRGHRRRRRGGRR